MRASLHCASLGPTPPNPLQDRELTKAASKALSTLAVLDAGAGELPILYANSRCADLCGGAPREGLVGTDLAQVPWASGGSSCTASVASFFCRLRASRPLSAAPAYPNPTAQALQLSPGSVEQLAAALEQASTTCLLLEVAARPVDATFTPVADASSGLLLYWVACLDQQAQPESAAAEPEAAEPDFNDGAAEGPGGQEEQASMGFAPAIFTAGQYQAGSYPCVGKSQKRRGKHNLRLLPCCAGSVEGQLGAGCIIEVVNEQFVELTGYSRADLGGVGGLGRLFGPDTEEGVAAKIAAAISSRQAGAWSVLLYRKDGTCRW